MPSHVNLQLRLSSFAILGVSLLCLVFYKIKDVQSLYRDYISGSDLCQRLMNPHFVCISSLS
jgi:hypothetical protein